MIIKNKQKRKVGILGGMGPQASSQLYNQLIVTAASRYGAVDNCDFPDLLIHSIPVPDFISDISKKETAKSMILESTRNLAACGVTAFAIACNTVHVLLPELKTAVRVPFISIIESVVGKCTLEKIRRVGLVASPTMLSLGLYTQAFGEAEIEVVIPSMEEHPILNAVIRTVLAGKKIPMDLECEYIKCLKKLFDQNIDTLIVGCTELPLAINYHQNFDSKGHRCMSTLDVLVDSILEYVYEK